MRRAGELEPEVGDRRDGFIGIKFEAVKLVRERGVSVAQAARDLACTELDLGFQLPPAAYVASQGG